MFQESAGLALDEMRVVRDEQTRLAFVTLLQRAYKESGLKQSMAVSLGIEPGAFSRATNEDKEKFKKPQYATLFRWCRIMYKYAGLRDDTQKYETIMQLAGYAIPSQVEAAMKRTTEELAVQPSPSTDALGDLGEKSYRQRVQKVTAATKRQFKTPLDTSL